MAIHRYRKVRKGQKMKNKKNKLKLVFSKIAAGELAKELRRASWGMTVAAAGGGTYLDAGSVLVAGAIGWVVLQISAFLLDSITNGD